MATKTKLQFSTPYHPQTNGQMEVVNRSLGKLLPCLVCDHIATWDLVLLVAEFAYTNSVNRSTRMSPFEVVTGIRPHLPVDLAPLPIEMRLSTDAGDFICHMQQVHDEVRSNIVSSNERYKQHVDARRHLVEFKEGDMVMV